MRLEELGPGLDTAILPTEPLAVEEMRTRQVWAERRACEPLDRLAIQAFRVRVLQEGPGPSLKAERPVGPALSSPPCELLEGPRRPRLVAGSDRRLHHLDQGTPPCADLVCVA